MFWRHLLVRREPPPPREPRRKNCCCFPTGPGLLRANDGGQIDGVSESRSISSEPRKQLLLAFRVGVACRSRRSIAIDEAPA